MFKLTSLNLNGLRSATTKGVADWVAQLYCQRSARELRWQLDVDPLEV